MKKIDHMVVTLLVEEATPNSDRMAQLFCEYVISDLQDKEFRKRGKFSLNLELADALLFATYTAINQQEGTTYNPGKPESSALTAEEVALIEVTKKRLAEYPSVEEWIDADFDARVNGDTSKRDALDAKKAAVKKKYPMPEKIKPTVMARVKAFFGF